MIVLGLSSFIVEMMLAVNIPWWRQNAHRLKWFNMIISIALSSVLGFLFGAAGLVVMGAALFGTVLSIPGYAFLNWNYDTEIAKTKYEGNRYKYAKKESKPKIVKAKELGSDLIKVGYVTGKVITAPLWISRKIYNYCKS